MAVLIVIAVLIAINALYVAAEFASVAARRTRIETLAEEGHRAAQRLLPHLRDAAALDRYVAACQIGITVSSLLLGAYGQDRLSGWLRVPLAAVGLHGDAVETTAAVVVLLALTGLQVVIGELLPKSLAIRNPERMALALSVPMDWSLRLLSWFIKTLNGAGNLILRALRVPTQAHRHVHSPEELEHLLAHGSKAGELPEEERRQLGRVRRVLRFAERRVADFMVPRARVVALDADADEAQVLRVTQAHPFTRYPVYGDGPDDVRGLAHVKDLALARAEGRVELAALLRPLQPVPQQLLAHDALERMRQAGTPMLRVVDEHGGNAGVVTLSDLMEGVLGEPPDESRVT